MCIEIVKNVNIKEKGGKSVYMGKKKMKHNRRIINSWYNTSSVSCNNSCIINFSGNNYRICVWRKWNIQISARGKR